MDRGIYAAGSGGLIAAHRLDVTAGNLANASTVGYKAERLVTRQQEFADTLVGALPGAAQNNGDQDRVPGVVSVETQTDFSQGSVMSDENPLHVALTTQNAFFVVQTPQGEMLTRAGNFTRDAEGNLVTQDGFPVSGEGGPITMPPGSARIADDGSVVVNREVIGRVRVVEVSDLRQLKRVDGTRFQPNGAALSNVNSKLIPESVEMPNTEIVTSMVDMINAQKAFEAYTKTVRTLDELNERSMRNARLAG